jgi:hypothetical protein
VCVCVCERERERERDTYVICHTKGRKQIKSVRQQGAEENIETVEEVKGGWRRVHNVELHNLYALPLY